MLCCVCICPCTHTHTLTHTNIPIILKLMKLILIVITLSNLQRKKKLKLKTLYGFYEIVSGNANQSFEYVCFEYVAEKPWCDCDRIIIIHILLVPFIHMSIHILSTYQSSLKACFKITVRSDGNVCSIHAFRNHQQSKNNNNIIVDSQHKNPMLTSSILTRACFHEIIKMVSIIQLNRLNGM